MGNVIYLYCTETIDGWDDENVVCDNRALKGQSKCAEHLDYKEQTPRVVPTKLTKTDRLNDAAFLEALGEAMAKAGFGEAVIKATRIIANRLINNSYKGS